MQVKLGYVAIALSLPKVTSSSTVTYTNYQKLNSEEKRLNKLKQVTLSNLDDLYKLLEFNVQKNIHFYRITSHLVPLATHPEVCNWNYRTIFRKDFEIIGNFIKKHNMRVDTHPDEFNVLNSIKEEVVVSTERNLMQHIHFFKDIEYPKGRMVLHIGSSQGGKEEASKRFLNNFKRFPREITERLILENDDKTFNASEVLKISKELNSPMVLDVHHHLCNNNGEALAPMLEDIFNTWNGQPLPPKVHFSSPRDGDKDRKHADFINTEAFISFIEMCLPLNRDFDVMLEAKKKDLALFKLIEELRKLKKEWHWVDETTLEF